MNLLFAFWKRVYELFTTSKNLHNCMKAVVAQETTVMLNATVMLIWMLNATVMLDESILKASAGIFLKFSL